MTYEQQESLNWIQHLPHTPKGYGLSSTPLNDTIMAAMYMVPEFPTVTKVLLP